MQTPDSQHWSDYWAQGRLTSLPQDFAANYDGEIAEFWRQQFSPLPHDAQVLDLCAGNGAIALLAADFASAAGHRLQISAVDAARIDPTALARQYPDLAPLLSMVRLIEQCRVEELDLPAAQFDLITSQYGIEYCDWTGAAAQVARLLKPGARFVMLCHAPDSDILKFMQGEQAEYALLEQLHFFGSISDWLAHSSSYQVFQSTLMQTRTRLVAHFRQSQAPLFASVLTMLDRVLAMNEALLQENQPNLERFHADLKLGYARLNDMLRVNLAIRDNPQWHQVFAQAGLELIDSGNIIYQRQHQAGYYLRFEKPVSAKPT